MATKRKAKKKPMRRRRTTKEPVLTKLGDRDGKPFDIPLIGGKI